jgi:uncharacterized DUF497 family protein
VSHRRTAVEAADAAAGNNIAKHGLSFEEAARWQFKETAFQRVTITFPRLWPVSTCRCA